MKKFLYMLLLFILPILILGCTMEMLLRHIPNSYKTKSAYLKSHHDSIKTLLVGSSHVFYGINPEFLTDEALNYGNVSQTIDIDYQIVNRHINDLKALETVVLRLSYTTLFEQLKKGDESWRLKDYRLYTDVDVHAPLKFNFEILTVKLKSNLERLYNFYILNKSSEIIEPSGWSTIEQDGPSKNMEASGERIAKKHTIVNQELYEANFRNLEHIIQQCKDKGIRVILVTMPAYSSYIAHLDNAQLQKTILAGELMQAKYDNCTYFNFLSDMRFGGLDFIDADHLNRQGAEKFSKVIDSILTQ